MSDDIINTLIDSIITANIYYIKYYIVKAILENQDIQKYNVSYNLDECDDKLTPDIQNIIKTAYENDKISFNAIITHPYMTNYILDNNYFENSITNSNIADRNVFDWFKLQHNSNTDIDYNEILLCDFYNLVDISFTVPNDRSDFVYIHKIPFKVIYQYNDETKKYDFGLYSKYTIIVKNPKCAVLLTGLTE